MKKNIGVLSLWVILIGAFCSVGMAYAQSSPPSPSSPLDVHAETGAARDLLTQAMTAYRQRDFQSAFKLSRAAYLDHFELIEPPLRVLNQDLTLDMEFRFADLRSKMEFRKPAALVEPAIASVRAGLTEIDGMFGGVGVVAPLIALGGSFVIAIREGLEALLVIGTLLGALRASQSRALGRYILGGAALAVVVSLSGWALLHVAIRSTPIAQQVVSAVASLIAVGMLLWVNVWLLRRRDPKYWMETMNARAWAAMTSGSSVGLALIGFSAVLRQGVETALLYEVLIGYSQGVLGYVVLGVFAALFVMIGVAWLLARTGRNIPIAAFLRIAVPLLMLLSVAFVGGAIYQLQESGYVPTTSIIRNFPRLSYFVAEVTGIHPTAEGLGAQAGLIVIYALLLTMLRLRAPKAALRRVVAPLSLVLLISLLSAFPAGAQPSGWQVIYLYRDESVESNQGYQVSSLMTNDTSDQPHPLHRFPIDGISIPWDVPPPSAISPDGSTLALIQWDEKQGGALTLNLSDATVKVLPGIKVKGLFDTTILGWTHDGTHLILYNAGIDGGQVASYDVAKNTLMTLLTLSDALTIDAQVTLSPDSSRLIYCTTKGNGGCGAYAIRALDGSPATPIPLPVGMTCSGYPALKWSPNGHSVALDCMISATYGLTLIDTASGKVTQYPLSSEVNDLAWAPDGSRLLLDLCAGIYVNADDPDCGPLQYMDPTNGALTPGPAIERSEARRLFWLGNTLVFDESSGGGQDATLYFYDIQTQKNKQFSRNSSSYQDASFIVLGVRPLT